MFCFVRVGHLHHTARYFLSSLQVDFKSAAAFDMSKELCVCVFGLQTMLVEFAKLISFDAILL